MTAARTPSLDVRASESENAVLEVSRSDLFGFVAVASDLLVVHVHGRLGAGDVDTILGAIAARAPTRDGLRILVDALDLEPSGAPAACERLWRFTPEAMPTPRVAHVALVHGEGTAGAMAVGWAERAAWPTSRFTTREAALAALAAEHLGAPLAALRSAIEPAVKRVQALLREEPGLALADLARGAGLSVARLQALFRSFGTTFREARVRVRLDLARDALVRPGAKIEAVALETGFHSATHLATSLRKHHGVLPSELRKRVTQASSHVLSPPTLPPPAVMSPAVVPAARPRPRRVDRATYLASPSGACAIGRAWFVLYEGDFAVCGLQGFFDMTDLRDFLSCVDAFMHHARARDTALDVICDMRAADLTKVTSDVLDATLAASARRVALGNRVFRKYALVVSDTPVGGFFAGMSDVNQCENPFDRFERFDDALAWLARPDMGWVDRELREVRALIDARAPILAALEGALAREPGASQAQVARALGLSRRTMQRALAEAGTSFSDVAARLIAERSRVLLTTTDMAIDDIAHEVGLRSRSRLYRIVHKRFGVSPGALRERGRHT